MKVAIYARYSSDNQREASIADQFRICREFARKQGWTIAKEYSDHAVSGATLLRSGFQAMMASALRKEVDVVLAESLDRFSRDQEDTAGLFKRLTFAGVSIVTLAEGDITFLHIGLKGTMNAMFLKELADKTRRGLRGRVELGKSGGGVSYGYRILRRFENGIVSTGEREVVPEEADIIRRIFKDYAAGLSPKQIAKDLNREGLRGPRGALWSPSTIHGNPTRGMAGLSGAKRDLERVKREIQKVIEAIVDGVKGSELKERMADLQDRKDALLKQTDVADEPPPLLHPSMADLYRNKVEELAAALQREDTRLEASESLRGLIDSIVLIPEDGQLRIELRGNLAAMLTAAQQTKRSPETGDLLMPIQLVAGAGFEPATFGL